MRFLTFSFLKNCKLKNMCYAARMVSGSILQPAAEPSFLADPTLVQVSPSWSPDEEPVLRAAVVKDMLVYPEFISEREEVAMLTELEPRLRRMRYEFDHWDNAIHGFRETERREWTEENEAVLARVRARAFGPTYDAGRPLPHAHVLDLAAAGHIKPHIDAVRFCGDVIAGLCLVSGAVMRLQHASRPNLVLDALLPQRALYVMKGSARYEFTHAVLGGEQSEWRGQQVPRRRRVAVICRTQPRPEHAAPDPAARDPAARAARAADKDKDKDVLID